MIKLFDVNEQNWLAIAALSVNENQKIFLDKVKVSQSAGL